MFTQTVSYITHVCRQMRKLCVTYNFIGRVYSVKRDYDAASVGGMKHIRPCHGFRRHHDE